MLAAFLVTCKQPIWQIKSTVLNHKYNCSNITFKICDLHMHYKILGSLAQHCHVTHFHEIDYVCNV